MGFCCSEPGEHSIDSTVAMTPKFVVNTSAVNMVDATKANAYGVCEKRMLMQVKNGEVSEAAKDIFLGDVESMSEGYV